MARVPPEMAGGESCSLQDATWKLYRSVAAKSIRNDRAYTTAAQKRRRASFGAPRGPRPRRQSESAPRSNGESPVPSHQTAQTPLGSQRRRPERLTQLAEQPIGSSGRQNGRDGKQHSRRSPARCPSIALS